MIKDALVVLGYAIAVIILTTMVGAMLLGIISFGIFIIAHIVQSIVEVPNWQIVRGLKFAFVCFVAGGTALTIAYIHDGQQEVEEE